MVKSLARTGEGVDSPDRDKQEMSASDAPQQPPDPIDLQAITGRIANITVTFERILAMERELLAELEPAGVPPSTRESQGFQPSPALFPDPAIYHSPWSGPLLLESPALRKALRIQLVRVIGSQGIWRDLGDIPDAGGFVPGLMLLMRHRFDPLNLGIAAAGIDSFLGSSRSRPETAADAILLAARFPPEDLKWAFNQLTVLEANGIKDLVHWLTAGMAGPRGPNEVSPGCPASNLAADFFKRKAFRGLRRNWARARGRAAGRDGHPSADSGAIEPWAFPTPMPGLTGPLEGQASLLAEWYIGVLRGWREKPGFRWNSSTQARAKKLHLLTIGILERAEKRENFMEWVTSSFNEFRGGFSIGEREFVGPMPSLAGNHPRGGE